MIADPSNARSRRRAARASGALETGEENSRAAKRAARKLAREERALDSGTDAKGRRRKAKPLRQRERKGGQKAGRQVERESSGTNSGSGAQGRRAGRAGQRKRIEAGRGGGASEKIDALKERGVRGAIGERALPDRIAVSVLTGVSDVDARLFDSIRKSFGSVGVEVATASASADLIVRFRESTAEAGQADAAAGKIATALLGRIGGESRDNAVSPRAPRTGQAIFLPLDPIIRRYGADRMLNSSETLTLDGADAVAADLTEAFLLAATGATRRVRREIASPTALNEALATSENSSELLSTLAWSAQAPPKSLDAPCEPEAIEAFVDGAIMIEGGEVRTIPFATPFDWNPRLPGREAENAVYGLDFLSSVLCYWFQKANRASSKAIDKIDSLLKTQNLTASALLARAGETILDLLANRDALPEAAWTPQALLRRGRAFELFLLCCRMAALRKIKFDEAACGPVFRELLDILLRLRPVATLNFASADSFTETIFWAGLALPVRKTSLGALLLQEALNSICSLRVPSGLTRDGVWREGFGEHCAVLSALNTLSGDLRLAGVSDRRIVDATASLSIFVDAFLMDNGFSPPIAGFAPADRSKIAALASAALKKSPAGSKRPTHRENERDPASGERFHFPDAGLFVSKFRKTDDRKSSHLAICARSPGLGGMSLSFAVDSVPVLIGGGSVERKARLAVREAHRFNAAARNAIRVNAKTHDPRGESGEEVRITKVWGAKRWSAARVSNSAFPDADIARTIIHLKAHGSLLVVDDLVAKIGEASFEQFWHLSPELRKLDGSAATLCFTSPRAGFLSVSFDGDQDAEILSGGAGEIGWTATVRRKIVPNPYIRRSRTADRVLMGSLFHCGAVPARHAIRLEPAAGGWEAAVSGDTVAVKFAFDGEELQFIE